jgi:hypothetical protein
LGQRCALSTRPGATAPTQPSKYQKAFKQGATIVPRSFYFVRIPDFNGTLDPESLYWAETDPEQAALAQPDYRDVRMSGLVEATFIYSTAIAKHLLPFAVLKPVTVVLPVLAKNGILTVCNSDVLRREGYREFGKWVATAELGWTEKRQGKAGKQDLVQWLDYQGKLSAQDLTRRHLVLYNAAGTNVVAACFNRDEHNLPFVVDHKLYGAAFSNPEEASYITAILNSATPNELIKPFQSTGLLGERDVHKKILELPIPPYDQANKKHQALAELGGRAREEAAATVRSGGFPGATSIGRKRAFVRKNLKVTLAEIDRIVRSIL